MRKALFITYYWPPAGGPGVQRVLKFVKYLPEFGWKPIVLTVKDGDYSAVDNSLINEIPENCKIYKTRTLEPFNLYKKFTGQKEDSKISTNVLIARENESIKKKLARWVRFNMFIPDARVGWIPFLIYNGMKIIKQEKPDVIFCTSPPHSLQIGAKILSELSGIPIVTDFRDPWSEFVHYQSIKRFPLTVKIDKGLEKSVLRNSNMVTTISDVNIEYFKDKTRLKDTAVIPNGFDEDDFSAMSKTKRDIFTITYTGAMTEDRVPHVLIKSVRILKDEGYNLQVRIIGNVSPMLRKLTEEASVEDMFRELPYVPHNEVLKSLCESDLLLLVINNVPDNKGIITGKIFDYLGSGVRTLGIGPVNGEASEILQNTEAGDMFDYNDVSGVTNFIKEMIDRKNKGIDLSVRIPEEYSRKKQTQKLAGLFEKLC